MNDQPSAAEVRRRYAETAIQKTALGVGVVFLLVGVAGFIPGVTQNIEGMTAAGHTSEAMLFGVFQVSVLHRFDAAATAALFRLDDGERTALAQALDTSIGSVDVAPASLRSALEAAFAAR